MAKSKKRNKQAASKKKTSKRKKQHSGTNQPFEQDSKRRIGQYGGTGEPPIMQ